MNCPQGGGTCYATGRSRFFSRGGTCRHGRFYGDRRHRMHVAAHCGRRANAAA